MKAKLPITAQVEWRAYYRERMRVLGWLPLSDARQLCADSEEDVHAVAGAKDKDGNWYLLLAIPVITEKETP